MNDQKKNTKLGATSSGDATVKLQETIISTAQEGLELLNGGEPRSKNFYLKLDFLLDQITHLKESITLEAMYQAMSGGLPLKSKILIVGTPNGSSMREKFTTSSDSALNLGKDMSWLEADWEPAGL